MELPSLRCAEIIPRENGMGNKIVSIFHFEIMRSFYSWRNASQARTMLEIVRELAYGKWVGK